MFWKVLLMRPSGLGISVIEIISICVRFPVFLGFLVFLSLVTWSLKESLYPWIKIIYKQKDTKQYQFHKRRDSFPFCCSLQNHHHHTETWKSSWSSDNSLSHIKRPLFKPPRTTSYVVCVTIISVLLSCFDASCIIVIWIE